jgi:hypothetical protein
MDLAMPVEGVRPPGRAKLRPYIGTPPYYASFPQPVEPVFVVVVPDPCVVGGGGGGRWSTVLRGPLNDGT